MSTEPLVIEQKQDGVQNIPLKTLLKRKRKTKPKANTIHNSNSVFTSHTCTIPDNLISLTLRGVVVPILHLANTNCFAQSQAFWNTCVALQDDQFSDEHPPSVLYTSWRHFRREWNSIFSYSHIMNKDIPIDYQKVIVIKVDMYACSGSGHSWIMIHFKNWKNVIFAQSFQGRFDMRYTHRMSLKTFKRFMLLMERYLHPVKARNTVQTVQTVQTIEQAVSQTTDPTFTTLPTLPIKKKRSTAITDDQRKELSQLLLPNWDPAWPNHNLFESSKCQTVNISVGCPQARV